MDISFLTPTRIVLLVSDEALYVYKAGTGGAQLLEQMPWETEGFVVKVSEVIAKKGGGKSIVILNDMVEQHYRKERVTKAGVSILDRASFVQRKLMAAFPSYPVKAAYPLKDKVGTGKNASEIYLFAAVPASETFGSVVKAVRKSLAPVTGFFLLPVESADMVKTLAGKLSKSDKKQDKTAGSVKIGAQWNILIGQHRNGGLRQIVTKNGEIALTRMTPVSLDDKNVSGWASEIRQELAATMSYLSRFGYDRNDQLNVIVIAADYAQEAIRSVIETDGALSVLSVSEAGRLLRLPLGRQQDERFADILHVAWNARKSSFILPMKAKELEAVAEPRRMAVAFTFLLMAGACFMAYQGAVHVQAISTATDEVDRLISARANLQGEYDAEIARKDALGYNIALVQNALDIKGELDRQKIGVVDLYRNIGMALSGDLRLESVEIKRLRQPFEVNENENNNSRRSSRRRSEEVSAPKPMYSARLKMLFPSSTDVDAGNQEVRDFKKRLEELMPESEVEVVKFLKDYEFTEQVVVETGNFDARDLVQDYVAEILIKGRFE